MRACCRTGRGGCWGGRFNRSSQVMEMDIWERQGTAAADLAREDFSLRRRVRNALASCFTAR